MRTIRYLELADQLAAELAGCPPGWRVPSENEISARFGVGRAAARATLQELERRLLVHRVQGLGTFVNRRIDYTISHDRRPSWHRTVAAAGARPRSVVREIDRRPLPDGPAALLGLQAGTPAWMLVRQSYIDDRLASWTHEWLPHDLVADLDLAMHAVESLDEVLRQLARVEPIRAWCRVSLDVPPTAVLTELCIGSSTPLWLVESLSRDATSGRSLMCSSAWMRADAVRVVVELGSQSTEAEGGRVSASEERSRPGSRPSNTEAAG